jgi:hypothetical protein
MTRPIAWGTIWLVIGLVGWVIFSVIAGVGKGVGAEPPGVLMFLVRIFGAIFFLSLPVALIAELVRWLRKR